MVLEMCSMLKNRDIYHALGLLKTFIFAALKKIPKKSIIHAK